MINPALTVGPRYPFDLPTPERKSMFAWLRKPSYSLVGDRLYEALQGPGLVYDGTDPCDGFPYFRNDRLRVRLAGWTVGPVDVYVAGGKLDGLELTRDDHERLREALWRMGRQVAGEARRRRSEHAVAALTAALEASRTR